MKIIEIIPLVMVTVCVLLVGWKTKRIAVATISVYALIATLSFFLSTFMIHHWMLNLFVFCPIAFALAWKAAMIDIGRNK